MDLTKKRLDRMAEMETIHNRRLIASAKLQRNPRLFEPSLQKTCIKVIAQNVNMYANDTYLEVLPLPLKDAIFRRIILSGVGFHNANVLRMLLHKEIWQLDLSTSTISAETFIAIRHKSLNLEELNLSSVNANFTTAELIDFIPHLSSVSTLKLNNLSAVTNDVIKHLAWHCTNLSVLDLTRCRKLTNKCAKYLRNLTLHRLSVSHTNINNGFLKGLKDSTLNEHLEDINLNCCRVTPNGMKDLNWYRLQYASIDGSAVRDFDFMKNNGGGMKFMQWSISPWKFQL